MVVLFGAEEKRISRNGTGANDVCEARRLLYVRFTCARHEIHLMYGEHIPSRFVTEVENRIEAAVD